MDKYFTPVKSLTISGKRSSKEAKRPVPTKHTPLRSQKQDEGRTLLCVEKVGDGRQVTSWRPDLLHRLQREGAAYVPVQQVVMAVPQGSRRNPEGKWSLQPAILNDHRFTSLKIMMPEHPLEGVLLSVPHHSSEKETLQVDFPAAIDYLRGVYEIGIHLLEIIEDESRATTRFLVGSWQDPRMPHLPFYTPGVPGGPWFRETGGKHMFLETVRSYQSDRHLPHNLEFFLSLSSEHRARLEELCSETAT